MAYENASYSEEDNCNQIVRLKWSEQSQNNIVEMGPIVLVAATDNLSFDSAIFVHHVFFKNT